MEGDRARTLLATIRAALVAIIQQIDFTLAVIDSPLEPREDDDLN